MFAYQEFQLAQLDGRLSLVRVDRKTGRTIQNLFDVIEGYQPMDLTEFWFTVAQANNARRRSVREMLARIAGRILQNKA